MRSEFLTSGDPSSERACGIDSSRFQWQQRLSRKKPQRLIVSTIPKGRGTSEWEFAERNPHGRDQGHRPGSSIPSRMMRKPVALGEVWSVTDFILGIRFLLLTNNAQNLSPSHQESTQGGWVTFPPVGSFFHYEQENARSKNQPPTCLSAAFLTVPPFEHRKRRFHCELPGYNRRARHLFAKFVRSSLSKSRMISSYTHAVKAGYHLKLINPVWPHPEEKFSSYASP